MQSFRLNPILNTDSYKLTHWWQYPADTRHIYSYLESRGGMFDETMLALLQYIIKSNFAGQVFTLDDVEMFGHRPQWQMAQRPQESCNRSKQS